MENLVASALLTKDGTGVSLAGLETAGASIRAFPKSQTSTASTNTVTAKPPDIREMMNAVDQLGSPGGSQR